MQTEDRIRQFIARNLYFSEDNSIRDEDSFLETGVIDSMGVMELVAFIRSEFGVSVEPHEIVVENFDSVRKLAGFIRRKLAASAPPAEPQTCSATPPPTVALEIPLSS